MTTHGSAQWYDWPDNLALPFEEARQLKTAPVVQLGALPAAPERLALHSPTRHLITFAPTRAGKGAGLIIPSLLLWSASCLVIDPKGENAWRTAAARRAMGQTVHVLDPFGGVARYAGGEGETAARFNPLLGLSLDAPEQVRALAEALIIAGAEGRDSHWDNSALDLIEGLILYEIELAAREDGRAPSLVNVRRYLSDPEGGIVRAHHAMGQGFMAANKLARFAVKNPSPEILSIFSTAITQTSFLDNPRLQASLEGDSLRLADLATGQTTIYVVLPSELLDAFGRWLRLVIARAIDEVVRLQPLPNVLFVLDEFGTVGRLGAVARALGLMAGQGISIWAFLQDLSQLKKHYPEWQTFIANSSVVQFFGAGDYETARYFSEYIGQETIENRGEVFRPSFSIKTIADAMAARGQLLPADARAWRFHAENPLVSFSGRFTKLAYRLRLKPISFVGLSIVLYVFSVLLAPIIVWVFGWNFWAMFAGRQVDDFFHSLYRILALMLFGAWALFAALAVIGVLWWALVVITSPLWRLELSQEKIQPPVSFKDFRYSYRTAASALNTAMKAAVVKDAHNQAYLSQGLVRQQPMGRPLLYPDEIIRLDEALGLKAAMVALLGGKPVRLVQIPYFRRPGLAGLWRMRQSERRQESETAP